MKSIDHVAIAVTDADAAIPYYTDVLGLTLIGDEIAEDPGVRLVYLAAGDDKVQLVQPVRPGPVADWIGHHGEGLHHICFEVDDIPGSMQALDLRPERPVFRGGRGRRACFVADTPTGINIELTESKATF